MSSVLNDAQRMSLQEFTRTYGSGTVHQGQWLVIRALAEANEAGGSGEAGASQLDVLTCSVADGATAGVNLQFTSRVLAGDVELQNNSWTVDLIDEIDGDGLSIGALTLQDVSNADLGEELGDGQDVAAWLADQITGVTVTRAGSVLTITPIPPAGPAVEGSAWPMVGGTAAREIQGVTDSYTIVQAPGDVPLVADCRSFSMMNRTDKDVWVVTSLGDWLCPSGGVLTKRPGEAFDLLGIQLRTVTEEAGDIFINIRF